MTRRTNLNNAYIYGLSEKKSNKKYWEPLNLRPIFKREITILPETFPI